ncbi:hypothetical protein K3495_g2832 [Podosphaera aphanis]|nr:hypothetical protein K3495_g2832 [Podosphaera aphanis]
MVGSTSQQLYPGALAGTYGDGPGLAKEGHVLQQPHDNHLALQA